MYSLLHNIKMVTDDEETPSWSRAKVPRSSLGNQCAAYNPGNGHKCWVQRLTCTVRILCIRIPEILLHVTLTRHITALQNRGWRKETDCDKLFPFPKDQGEKQAWYNLIKRRNNMDGFKVTATTVLCDKHFERDKIYRPAGGTKVRLLKDSRPVLHKWNVSENKRKITERKPPKIRCQSNSTDICDRLSGG